MTEKRKSVPTRQQTKRQRNPGKAIFSHRTEDPELGAIRRSRAVLPVEPDWDQLWLTAEQANERGLTSLRKIAEVHGYSIHAVQGWAGAHRANQSVHGFPKPKARLYTAGPGSGRYLYSAREVVEWMQQMLAEGKIQQPHRKQPKGD